MLNRNQSANLLLSNDKTTAKGRILIVEDESIVALDIKNSLESWGYNIVGIAQTGEEAIQKSLRIRPDLVLMDIRLQGDMDGVETARQISTHVDLPFIYLTSYADSNLLLRAKLTAPFGYILKPFGDRELHIAIELSLYKHVRDREQLQATREELQTTRSQLIQSEKLSSLGQMVAEVAHEINNALTSIHANLPCVQSYAEFLEQAISSYEAACPQPALTLAECDCDLELSDVRSDFPQMLRSMQEGASRIRELALRLQNFSRLDAAQPQPVDLLTVIESTLALLQHRLKNGIKVTKQYAALPLVECRAGQINQVFLNLLTNALDAVGESAELTICVWQSDPDWVTVSVRDNGPGISPEIQPRIFEPFFTTKEIGKGTGLGLSICQQIICQVHGGQIRCISELGHGAEFRVELPVSGVSRLPCTHES